MLVAENLFGEIVAWGVITVAFLCVVYVIYSQIQLRKIERWVSDIPNQIQRQKQEWDNLGK